ncbi:MAG: glycosyltransferase family 2 protein [Clostridiales bacterium]|nr:glycosyltransferase family 2 protein [Clostridiales bacterium]
MRYIIVTPTYNHRSAGIKVLYELQKWLIRSGKDAIVFNLNAPYPINEDDIVVYPEIVPGNPLGANRVVRYILNEPGKLGGTTEYDENEILVAYTEHFSRYSKGIYLEIPVIEDFFYDKGLERTVDCFYVGKGSNTRHPSTETCIEITAFWPEKRQELAELLNRTRILYSYDDCTHLLTEARLCGCIIKLINNNGLFDLVQPLPPNREEFQQQLDRFIQMTWYPEMDPCREAARYIEAIVSKHSIADKSQGIPKVSIIIPLFNQAHLTRICVQTIQATPAITNFELILVDNGSTDWTPEYLISLGESVRVITNSDNLGFARACNQGARVARGDILLFLNNDTVPRQGWLDELVAAIDNDEADICGARLIYPDGHCQHAGIAFDERGLGYHIFAGFRGDSAPVIERRLMQAVTGACMAIKKCLFHELEGFDEGFRNGFEDVDLCLRAGERGKRILFIPESVVVHHSEQSRGRKDNEIPNLKRFFSRWKDRVRQDDTPLYARFGLESRRDPDGNLMVFPVDSGNRNASSITLTKLSA